MDATARYLLAYSRHLVRQGVNGTRPFLAAALVLLAALAGCGGGVGVGANVPGNGNNAIGSNGNQVSGGNSNSVPNDGGTTETGSGDATIFNATREAGPVATRGQGLGVFTMRGCTPADYFVDATIGGQKVSLLVDSGSSTLGVASTDCTSCPPITLYDPSTGKATNQNASSLYGVSDETATGWQGDIYRDNVVLFAGGNTTRMAADVNVVAIEAQSSFFSPSACSGRLTYGFDGILGVGPDALLLAHTTSLVSSLEGEKQLAHDAFSVQTCGEGGNLFVGGYPADVVRAQPAFAPMYVAGGYDHYYTMAWQALGIGGKRVAANYPAIVDNGTSVIGLPTNVYSSVTRSIAADSNYLANFSASMLRGETDCEASAAGWTRAQVDAALPRFSFSFQQKSGTVATVSLPASYSYLYPVVDSDNIIYYCTAVYGVEQPFVLFGNAGMRKHLVIFDRDNMQIGFAEQDSCGDEIMGY